MLSLQSLKTPSGQLEYWICQGIHSRLACLETVTLEGTTCYIRHPPCLLLATKYRERKTLETSDFYLEGL